MVKFGVLIKINWKRLQKLKMKFTIKNFQILETSIVLTEKQDFYLRRQK